MTPNEPFQGECSVDRLTSRNGNNRTLRLSKERNANTRAAISDASMSIFDQGDDSTDLRGPVALRGGGVAPSVARYPRNWASSLRELSAFVVCSVSIA
jgi:hypothetical protein